MRAMLILAFLLCGATGTAAAPAPQNCSFDSTRTLVFCRVSRWSPWLLHDDSGVNRSDIVSLHVHVLKESYPLTRVHLRGFIRLKSLVVQGTCPSSYNNKWCYDAAGVSEIDYDAFEETPKLEKLRLHLHPLSDILPVSRLRNLRILHLYWLKNLTTIKSEAVQGSKATLEEFSIWYTSFYELPESIFNGFPRLRVLEITAAYRLDIGSRAISNLPALRSFQLYFFLSRGVLTLDKWALSNISNLEEANLYSINNFTVIDEPACSGGGALRELTVRDTDLGFLATCPLFLKCSSCPTQTLSIMRSFLSSRSATSLLPRLENMSVFNITRLELYQTSFIYPFDMFSQLPRLRTLIIEHSMRGKSTEGFQRLPQFFNNPFTLLPASVRLREVRITVHFCGCRLLEIFDWMRQNALASNRTLQETLFLDCLQVDSICSEGLNDQRRFIRWMDLGVLEPLLRAVCPRSSTEVMEIATVATAQEMEELKCRCTEIQSCASVGNITTATRNITTATGGTPHTNSLSLSLLLLIFLATILLG